MARQSSHRDPGKAAAQRLIDKEAKLLSSRHGVDRERVLSILEQTFNHSLWGSLFERSSKLFENEPSRLFDPSLHLALQYLTAEAALSLFEAGVEKLEERLSILDYLGTHRTVPFFSLEELKAFTRAFVAYLERNREVILLTGESPARFGGFHWLSLELSKLYYVKMADRVHLVQDSTAADNLERVYSVQDTTGPDLLEFPFDEFSIKRRWFDVKGRECSYEEAEIFSDLAPADAHRLEEARDTLFELKKNVLNELARALDRGSHANMWSNCLRLITSAITMDEADFYLRMDRWYEGYDIRTGDVVEAEAGLIAGGLTAILEIVGHYEKELSIGTMAKTKRELTAMGVTFQESETPFRLWGQFSAPDCYFGLTAAGRREELDGAVERFLDRDAQERDFWKNYRNRVVEALENEFYAEVVWHTKVRKKHVHEFEPHIRTYSQWVSAQLEFTGTTPRLSISQAEVQTIIESNVFRKEAAYWTIAFQGQTIRLKDSRGLKYISHLLRDPGIEFHCLELTFVVGGRPGARPAEVHKASHLDSLAEEGVMTEGLGNAGPLVDQQARSEYKRRLAEIAQERDDAESNFDLPTAAALREEEDQLRQQLVEGFGLGGRPRKGADVSERARKSVSAAISRSLAAIQREHDPLWLHLSSAVKMGTFLSYSPESPTSWDL